MRLIVSLAAITAVSSLAVAQTTTLPQNKIRAWDQTTEFTTRGSNGGAAGYVSQAFTPGQVMGWTDISYIQYVAQDFQISTQDAFDIKYAPLNSKGLPDYGKSVMIIKDVKLPATGSGIAAYLVTHNLNGTGTATNKPFKLPATAEQWHLAWFLKDKPGAKWTATNGPTDGQSVHMSNAGPQLPSGTGILCVWSGSRVYHREIPRQEMVKGSPVQIKEGLGWTSNPPTTQGPQDPSSNDLSYRLDIGSTTPGLYVAVDNLVYNGKPTGASLACPNPNEGYAGLDPDFNHNAATGTPRYDNPVWKIEAGTANGNGVAALFWSQAILPKALPVFGGNFFLDITDPLFNASPILGGSAIVLDTAGAGKLTVNLGSNKSNLRVIASSFPNWHAQALIIHAKAGISLTNLATMRPMMKPGKFVAATADVKKPALLTRPSGSSTFFIRNDGAGALTVQTFVKTQHFSQFDVVIPERTSMRIRLFGPATNMKVLAKYSNATNFAYMWNY